MGRLIGIYLRKANSTRCANGSVVGHGHRMRLYVQAALSIRVETHPISLILGIGAHRSGAGTAR